VRSRASVRMRIDSRRRGVSSPEPVRGASSARFDCIHRHAPFIDHRSAPAASTPRSSGHRCPRALCRPVHGLRRLDAAGNRAGADYSQVNAQLPIVTDPDCTLHQCR
jgi:hypothetical protein